MHESRSAHRIVDALIALARRWRLMAPFVLATPLVVFALTARTPATYESSADVLLDRKGEAISQLRAGEWYYFDAPRAMRTQVQLARLPEVERRALAAAAERGVDATALFGRSTVSDDGVTDLLTFHVRDGNPVAAAELATLYAEQYVAHRRALDTQALRRASAVVSAQLAAARAQGADPSTYAGLIEKQQQLQTELATISGNARVVRPGGEAERVAPTPWRDASAALVLGLVLGLGLAGLAGTLDARPRSADEISEGVGLPVVGRLPLERASARTSPVLALLEGDHSEGAEAVRVLRASLPLARLRRDKPIVMVTSAVAGEGKSTTTASLAVSFALAGRDVVLVDLDVRRPAMWRIFDVPKGPGIAELARGLADVADVTHPVSLSAADGTAETPRSSGGTLRVVPAGNTLAADPGSIVAGPGLGAALETLRTTADIVLVDSPPALQTGDVVALGSLVDALVLVAQTGRFRRHYARELERLLAFSLAIPLGLVVIGDPHELAPAARSASRVRPELGVDMRGLGQT